MNKMYLTLFLSFILSLNAVFATNDSLRNVPDVLNPALSAKLGGYLGEKLDASYYNRILAQDVDRLISPFKNRTEDHLWQGEFWGKWITSAILAYKYEPSQALKVQIDKAVNGLIKTQSADGYIGNYAVESRLMNWDIWGQKYCLLGLIAYYDQFNDQNSLNVASKMVDYLIKTLNVKKLQIVETGLYHGMASTSILEPIVLLYNRTKNPNYLQFAEDIVRQWELPVGPQLISKSNIDVGSRFLPFPNEDAWVSQGQKAYEMMSCYEGLLELYRITGKAAYIEAVEKSWQNIADNEIYITGSGSASECWYHGKELQQFATKHSQETCVTVTWIKLSQQLLLLTGNVKYADAIEKSYYNALLGAMTTDGCTWGMYSPIMGIRSLGTNQCNMGLNCCVANGPRGLFTLPLNSVVSGINGIKVIFYNEGEFKVKTPNGQIADLKLQTNYPISGKIDILLKLEKPEKFKLEIRIPSWSKQTSLNFNGDSISYTSPGTYISFSEEWKTQSKIETDFDMDTKVGSLGNTPTNLYLQRGPIILARDFRFNNEADIDETITPVFSKDVTVEINNESANPNFLLTVKIPCLVGSWRLLSDSVPIKLTFCDYASAGNTFSQASRYRVLFPQLIDITDQWLAK